MKTFYSDFLNDGSLPVIWSPFLTRAKKSMHLNTFLGNAFSRIAFSKPKNAFSPNANWPMTVEYAHSMRSARENNLNFSVNTMAQSVYFEFRVVNLISFGINFDRFLSFRISLYGLQTGMLVVGE